jgi:predicted Zn-dependent protease
MQGTLTQMVAYTLDGEKWTSQPITWSFAEFNYAGDFLSYSSFMNQAQYQTSIEQALAAWGSVANITFQQIPDSSTQATAADIRIGFADLNTTSSDVIGYTEYRYVGTTFQPDTQVTLEDPGQVPLTNTLTYQGFNASFYQIALHEIGRALGLNLSTDPSSVMYATTSSANETLDATDIAGIQAIYGPPTNSITSEIYRLYETSFDRTPDQTGSLYWSSVLANGASLLDIAQNFAISNEFQNDYAHMSITEFVSTLYANALHRAPDVGGLQYFTGILQAGASRASVLVDFSDSSECRSIFSAVAI